MSKKSRRFNTPEFNFVPEDVKPYYIYNSIYNLCSADDIINRIKYDSILNFKNIRKGILDLDLVFVQDNSCLCDIGRGKRPLCNKFICNACNMLKRVMENIKLNDNKLIEIKTGKFEGKNLKIYEYDDVFMSYNINENLNCLNREYSKMEFNLNLLEDSYYNLFKRTEYMTTESYVTNYCNTSIFINGKMQKYKIPNLILFEWVFNCGGNTKIIKSQHYNFLELNNLHSLSKNVKSATAQIKIAPLNESVVFSILKQLIVVLHFLSKYAFIHGRPCIDYLHFTNKPCVYKYGDIHIESPITLHLEPSFYSSFTYETDDGKIIRLKSLTVKEKMHDYMNFPIESLDIIISPKPKNVPDNYNIPLISELRSHFIYCYKIGNKIHKLITLHTEMGLPILQGSFEFYCFLISLLCEDSFYTTFIENEKLRTIWYSLWKENEYESVNSNLLKLKTKDVIEYEDITGFVSKYYLRSDALKHFWECISNI
jgi:hypothetical protein